MTLMKQSRFGWLVAFCLLVFGTSHAQLALEFDINQDPSSSDAIYLTHFDGIIYFAADDGIHGEELWQYDPLADGASLVADIAPGTTNSYPSDLTVYNGKLYFQARTDEYGGELWEYDPNENTIGFEADIWPGLSPSEPSCLTLFNGKLYFTANNGEVGKEIWSLFRYSDGCFWLPF